jgi:lactoylglutathione lyase
MAEGRQTANSENDGKNILMDVGDKYPGYTHVALRVISVKTAISALKENGIPIPQEPVAFADDGHVSVFVRDPDRNVVELRGATEDLSDLEGGTAYVPHN